MMSNEDNKRIKIYSQDVSLRQNTEEKVCCLFIFIRIKKGEEQGMERCHTKPMMSNEDNERLQYTLNMCHLGRTRRKKYKGRI